MKNYLSISKKYLNSHKKISIWLVIIVLVGGYYIYGKITNSSGETRYVLSTVEKGVIIQTVNASGQVSALDQVDIKPKVSGDIWWIGVKPGDKVYQGQALISLDDTSAKSAFNDAEQSLGSSKLQLQKDQIQAPIDYQNALDNLSRAKDSLVTTYNDTFNTVSNTYIDFPTIMTGMKNILFGYDLSSNRTQWNADILANMFSDSSDIDNKTILQTLAQSAESFYNTALNKYNTSLASYQDVSRFSTNLILDQILSDTIDTANAVSDTLQRELNFISKVIDISKTQNQSLSSAVTTMQTNAKSYLSNTNTIINNLLSQKKSIDSAKQSITSYEQNITLLEVGNPKGDNPISLQISTRNITKQEADLNQQKADLADYTITAPFAGVVASLPVKTGDTIGTGTTVTTLITDKKIATLSLNEVDAAKIKLGDKATLTFDAIDGLSLTGSVIELDTLGAVSQGVVSYSLKIGFDTQDPRVKSGMTVNAAIITNIKQDVLVITGSAVKTQAGSSYVMMFNPPLSNTGGNQGIISAIVPINQVVETGLSDDTNTEIVNGLKEGDQIVSRVITATANNLTATQSAPSLFGGGGARTTGGNATFRATTGR